MGRVGSKKAHSLNNLYHPPCRNDRRDPKLHQSTSTGSEDDSGPVERIGGVGSLYAEKRNLRTDKINEKSDCRIDCFLVHSEGNHRFNDRRHQLCQRLHRIQKVKSHF